MRVVIQMTDDIPEMFQDTAVDIGTETSSDEHSSSDVEAMPSTLGLDKETPDLDSKNNSELESTGQSGNSIVRFLCSDCFMGIVASLSFLILGIIYRCTFTEPVVEVGSEGALMILFMTVMGSCLSVISMFLSPISMIFNLIAIKLPTKLIKILNYGIIVLAFLLLACLVS